jgi:flagellar M-ring protein FliF
LESFLKTLQGFGIGRLVAILGAGAGVAAVLLALMFRVGGEPKSLLYSNLDLKEASQITAQLDQSGVKYEVKGDGSVIFVDRDKVASTRLLLSGKGLPTSGSVGYEIFDNAPALGQTDFVQNLNRQRALEGELARTIRSIQGVSFVRVHLVMPKHQLFDDDSETPSAAILIATNGGRLSAEQVRAIRNLVAGSVPDLKADRVSIADQQGDLLASEGDSGVSPDGAGGGARSQVEERIRRTVKDLVEGVVGAGKARVQVSADLDMARVTTQSEKYDPDGQVVRSTQTSDEKSNENHPNSSGLTSASQNVPGAQPGSGSSSDSNASGKQDETTNYEISKTTTTQVTEPGGVKRLSVAVAVDGVSTPTKGGKPDAYAPRSAEEMKHIEQLVRSAVGFDAQRGDQVTVVNVRFSHDVSGADGVTAASPFTFDKNDIMRIAELVVLLVMAGLVVFFVVKPMLSGAGGAGPAVTALSLSPRGPMAPAPGGGMLPSGEVLALPNPDIDSRLDIARIEGQVKASSVRRVSEFVDKHPDESVAILRSWLHET